MRYICHMLFIEAELFSQSGSAVRSLTGMFTHVIKLTWTHDRWFKPPANGKLQRVTVVNLLMLHKLHLYFVFAPLLKH